MDPAEELADLQNRFHLLEGDRKAFYEQSQLTLKQNKEVQDAMRGENKELRKSLANLQKERGHSGEASLMHSHEINKIEHQMTLLRQRQNAIASQNKQKEELMQKLQDQLGDLQTECQRPPQEANPLMRQIRTLENRLDKSMIKYNEAQSIRKTYDQIVKRLKEERVNFDNQLQAIEATLAAKEHDYEELLMMSHDANHAKDVAKQELQKLETLVAEEKKAREKELQGRRQQVQARQDMNARMEEREKIRQDIIMEAKGDLSAEAEVSLKANVVTNALHHELNTNVVEGEQQVMDAYETAFKKIKESTGVSDVNEVIQKFLTQEQTHETLVQTTKEAQARIEELNEEKHAVKQQAEDLKYSGSGAQGSRQEVDQWERKQGESQSGLERTKTRYRRIAQVFIDVRAGIEHMADKLELVKLDQAPIPVSDETMIEVLQQCDSKLLKMLEVVQQHAQQVAEEGDDAETSITTGALKMKADEGAAEPTNAYNCRVELDPQEDDESSDEGSDDGLAQEIPDREMMKKLHGMLMDKASNKSKKRRRRNFASGDGQATPSQEKGKGSGARGTRSMGRRADAD